MCTFTLLISYDILYFDDVHALNLCKPLRYIIKGRRKSEATLQLVRCSYVQPTHDSWISECKTVVVLFPYDVDERARYSSNTVCTLNRQHRFQPPFRSKLCFLYVR